jgi:2',3'-cyclic-nucleotide 2'-phosphodiesterase (5'-nucleotidase family)
VPDAVAPFKFGDISSAVNKQVKVLHGLGVHTIVVLAHAGGFMTPAPPSGEIISETAQMTRSRSRSTATPRTWCPRRPT